MKKAVKCVDAAERLLRVGLPALWEGGVRSGEWVVAQQTLDVGIR